MSSQSLIGYTIVVVFSCLIFGMAGYVAMIIVGWGNSLLNVGLPVSQDAFNTAWLIITTFIALPFVSLLLWVFDHIMNSKTSEGGVV